MCSAGAISALLFPLVCALCLHLECHFFLCSYVETACTLFALFLFFCGFLLFYCKKNITHSHPHTHTRGHGQLTSSQWVSQLSPLVPQCSIWQRWCLMVSDWSCSNVNTLCPVCHAVLRRAPRWPFLQHSTHEIRSSLTVHCVLAIQVRVVDRQASKQLQLKATK